MGIHQFPETFIRECFENLEFTHWQIPTVMTKKFDSVEQALIRDESSQQVKIY